MATKIYTKTGDKGKTSLIGGTKVPKSHPRIEAYGMADELNSYIGWVGDLFEEPFLREIQDRLFTIGSSLACDPGKDPKLALPDLKKEDVALLEKAMDEMSTTLPPMTSFLLPGGHPAVSGIHIARCVCRRTERAVVLLQEGGGFVEPLVLQYLNRLSDYLFVLALYAAHRLGVPDIPWKPRLG